MLLKEGHEEEVFCSTLRNGGSRYGSCSVAKINNCSMLVVNFEDYHFVFSEAEILKDSMLYDTWQELELKARQYESLLKLINN